MRSIASAGTGGRPDGSRPLFCIRPLLRLSATAASVLAVALLAVVVASISRDGAPATQAGLPARHVALAASQSHGPMPTPLAPAGSASCDRTVSSAAAATRVVAGLRGPAVVCVRSGTYPGLRLGGRHAGSVTVQPVPGATVTLATGVADAGGDRMAVVIQPGASRLTVHGFVITGEVELQWGDDRIRIDHDNITGGGYGVHLQSVNCQSPNAPTWSGCTSTPPITRTTISGNVIHNIGGPTGQDAINVNNYAGLRVTGNEIYGILEGGEHSDCFQSTFGGSGLVFDHNYEHDNQCQGFFTKDGDVTDAIVYDNLFLRDQAEHEGEGNLDIINTYHVVVRSNTSWTGNGDVIEDAGAAQPVDAIVEDNVLESFADGCCGTQSVTRLVDRNNLFGIRPWTFRAAISDRVRRPRFVAPDRDDYELANNPSGIGVNWTPATQHYGP